MAKYTLDANTCIYLMRRVPEQVFQRMNRCQLGDVVMSSITFAELEYGVLCAKDKLIASHAVALNLIMLTNNVDNFRHYPGVRIENWI